MADEKQAEKAERQKMEFGGSGTAKVSFKDAFGNDVKVKSSQWSSSGSVIVSGDEKDPTSAKLFAAGPGPATIKAMGLTEDGQSATASAEVLVVEKDAPTEGKIEFSVQPAPAKKKAEAPAAAEHHAKA